MSLVDSDKVRAATNARIARYLGDALGPGRKPPQRFWDHLSFCAVLFWALRKNKHLRAGQLLGIVLSQNQDKKRLDDHARLAYRVFDDQRRITGNEAEAFEKLFKQEIFPAECAHMLSRYEDDHLSHLIEDYTMNQQNHCDSK